jgi:hypothetical protein
VSVPSVSGLAPAGGGSGTAVTISGSGFSGATNVNFGGVAAASFTVNSDSEIVAQSPPPNVSGGC